MALEKANLAINFSKGLDQKSDPKQSSLGSFERIVNQVYTKTGLLQKRNGFGSLPSLPDDSSLFTTTFNGNLTAIGTSLEAFSGGLSPWVNKGAFASMDLSVLPLMRSNSNQIQGDSAVAPNGLVCTSFTDSVSTSGSATSQYKYVIADSATGQNIVNPTTITPSTTTVTGTPRVFVLGNYFVIVFSVGTTRLEYIAINIYNTSVVTAAAALSTTYTKATTVAFDGLVYNNNLYIALNGSDGGGAIRITYLDSTLVQHNTVVFATESCSMMSLCVDTSSTPVIYAFYYSLSGLIAKILAVTPSLVTVLAPTTVYTTPADTVTNVTCQAANGVCSTFSEYLNVYSYNAVGTNYISKRTVTFAGVVSSATIIARGVGLASKAFTIDGVYYFLAAYASAYQPTNFLLNSSGKVIAKLAPSNAGPYITLGLPGVTITDSLAQVCYFYRDQIIPVNKTQGVTTTAGVYAQTGLNLVSFNFAPSTLVTAEIGKNLHFTGGFMWAYDGQFPVEHGFHLYPDNVVATGSGAGGTIAAGTYYYQALYEWNDSQGNIHRSAPSVPTTATVTTGATSSITVNIPTLRLTYKITNPVKLVLYRASILQPIYYQVTSVTNTYLNSTTVDSIAIVDTLPDTSIVGNSILYTTGGVVENIEPPALKSICLFKSRLFGIDAEDEDLLVYSKQVIESTPVEMSDLFTIYMASTTGAQGSTGKQKCIAPMDDKLISFKRDAIYYLTGNGPDNTGAQNDFSDPIFITSTVGCSNQSSIVFIPQGLVFQSDKGFWLLSRNLETSYIGASVQNYNDDTVVSSVNVPGTNQVRFNMQSGVTLVYDYYENQWATFEGISPISSTLYQNLHTFIDRFGRVNQETPGVYLDGSNPVLVGFTTSWLNLMGLQGYERAYFFYMLATYLSPHKLQVQIGYDYETSPSQSLLISPDNYSPVYGDESIYGGGVYGGASPIEQWRVFFNKQKCQAFQITINEIYDASFSVAAGAGLAMSGINVVVGAKSKYPRIKAANTVG